MRYGGNFISVETCITIGVTMVVNNVIKKKKMWVFFLGGGLLVNLGLLTLNPIQAKMFIKYLVVLIAKIFYTELYSSTSAVGH